MKLPKNSAAAGFTLLELMVALILLSLIVLLLTSAFGFGTNVWSISQGGQSETDESLTTQDLLRRVLSEILPVLVQDDLSKRPKLYFVGKEDSLRFVTQVPAHLGIGGLHEVVIDLAEDDSGNHVEMSWHLFRWGRTPFASLADNQRTVLISKVNQLQFSYYGSRSGREPADWYSDWYDVNHLPNLIRMRVTFSDGTSTWPDLVVAPAVQSLNVIINSKHVYN